MYADGTGMRRVTTPPPGSTDTEPRFSPDGKKLVFTRFPRRGITLNSGRVTRHLRRLHGQPGWLRPTARHGLGCEGRPGGLVARRQADRVRGCLLPPLGGIYSVRADGSGFTAIVNGHGITGIGNENAFQLDGYYDPVWSPDGAKLIAGHEFLDDEGTYERGLVVVDADGSNLHWLSTEFHDEHQPDWGTALLE